MLKVGITGGIGSGKTTVCKVFETLGIPIYYADNRAKSLMVSDANLVAQIQKEFGAETYSNGQLNRTYLATKVFNDAEALAKLNAMVHPAVAKDATEWAAQQNNVAYTLKEAALLYEAGSYKQLDKIIVVTAPEALRIERVIKRDGSTEQEVLARMNKQWPENKKVKLADYIINNDGNTSIIEQVLAIHKKLIELSA